MRQRWSAQLNCVKSVRNSMTLFWQTARKWRNKPTTFWGCNYIGHRSWWLKHLPAVSTTLSVFNIKHTPTVFKMPPYIICGCFALVPFSIYPSRSASFSVFISYIIMDYLLSGKSHRLERASSHVSVIHPRDSLWRCHVGAETLSVLLSLYVNVMLQNNLMSLCLQLDLHEFSNTLKKTKQF